jgi:hypothetical protein
MANQTIAGFHDRDGNIGVGTTAPENRLHLGPNSGNVKLALEWSDSHSATSGEAYSTIYTSGQGGTYPFSGRGNLVLQPRNTDGNGSGDLVVMTGATATPKLVVQAGGNVGIGTVSPTAQLHVTASKSTAWLAVLDNSSDSGHGLYIKAGGTSGTRYITQWRDAAGTERFHMQDTGEMYAPSIGTGTDNSVVVLNSSGYFKTDEIDSRVWGSTLVDGSGTANYITKWSDADTLTNSVMYDDGTNIGIGITTPSAKVDVYQSGSTAFNVAGSQGQLFSVTDSLSGSLMSVNDISGIPILEVFSDDRVVMGQYGTDALVVNGTSVGVGTSAPVLPLHVRGQAQIGSNGNQLAHAALQVSAGEGGATLYRDIDIKGAWSSNEGHAITATHSSTASNIVGQMVFEYNSPGSRIKWGRLYHSGDQSTYPMQLVSNGSNANLGIGTGSPAYQLDVTGTIRATGDVIAYSDRRVKQDIVTLENSVDLVKKLRGVSYKKIGEDDQKIGVIAQEILEVLPQVVSKDENGMYSVAYGNMAGLFIEAIKEQQQHIETLEERIQKLEQLLTQKP